MMSKNVKILLIVGGILAGLAVVCIGGFTFFAYFFVDTKGISKSMDEGRNYGATTDHLGCQSKVLEMLKPVGDSQITETVKLQYFFDGCLEKSSPTPNFCDGLPNAYSDIFNEHKGKDAECAKLGMKGSIVCRQVIEKKLDYCDEKRK